jgi:hypothetical protein
MTGVDGVFSLREPASWPVTQPRLMLALLPQFLDGVRWPRSRSGRAEIDRVLAELDRDGVAILANAAPPDLVASAVRDLDRFVARMPELQGARRTKRGLGGAPVDYPVHEYQQELNIYRSHDPLAFSPAFARFLLLPGLLQVVASYLGRNWLYQAMIATRTEPSAPTRKGFAQWHHDGRGRKLNIFLLLSDVAEDGPATVVVKGSHRLLYARARRARHTFDDGEVAALRRDYRLGGERVCHAPAGSLVFFDANALHLGRRSYHRRDAFQVNCMTRRAHLWRQTIPQDVLASLAPAERRHLLRRADLHPG